MVPKARIRVQHGSHSVVVRFLDSDLFSEAPVRAVSDQLLRLADEILPRSVLILDFSGIESFSSTFIGRLILLHRRLGKAGSQLALCELSHNLEAILHSAALNRFFQRFRDQTEALEKCVLPLAPTNQA